MNAAVGVTTAVAMYFCGLGDPLLWGAMAFLLNYIPILGPLLRTVIFLLAGMLSFDSLWWALLPPALYFGIHLLEGEALTPMLLARRFTLNPVLVILSQSGHTPIRRGPESAYKRLPDFANAKAVPETEP